VCFSYYLVFLNVCIYSLTKDFLSTTYRSGS